MEKDLFAKFKWFTVFSYIKQNRRRRQGIRRSVEMFLSFAFYIQFCMGGEDIANRIDWAAYRPQPLFAFFPFLCLHSFGICIKDY